MPYIKCWCGEVYYSNPDPNDSESDSHVHDYAEEECGEKQVFLSTKQLREKGIIADGGLRVASVVKALEYNRGVIKRLGIWLHDARKAWEEKK
jgi:hypothetical protein